MKLYKIRGGSKQFLYNHAYNIGVGVSLGNKWFSMENILELIKWSLAYTKDCVVVYVADSIHAINIEVRQNKTPENAKRKALRLGKEILNKIRILTENEFPKEQLGKIHYANWGDLLTPKFRNKVEFLYGMYENNVAFRNLVLDIIEDHLQKENKIFSAEEKVKLGTYILEEIPELLVRVPIKGLTVDASVYPFDSKLFEFVEEIQLGRLFPEIKEKVLETEPKVFLEVR